MQATEYRVIETPHQDQDGTHIDIQTIALPDGENGRARILMSGTQTGGRFALIQMVVRREHEPPSHLHMREDEVIYVVDGTIVVVVDGARREYRPGESVYLPRGVEHAYCLRSEEARLLVLALPAGIEGFYREMDASLDDDRHVERLIALAARYGIEITGPGIREADTGS